MKTLLVNGLAGIGPFYTERSSAASQLFFVSTKTLSHKFKHVLQDATDNKLSFDDLQQRSLEMWNWAGGPPFALNLGCPILDGFQGWGFSASFSCVWFSHSAALNQASKSPPFKTQGWGTHTSKPSETRGPPVHDDQRYLE
jgi:hypothetical protein